MSNPVVLVFLVVAATVLLYAVPSQALRTDHSVATLPMKWNYTFETGIQDTVVDPATGTIYFVLFPSSTQAFIAMAVESGTGATLWRTALGYSYAYSFQMTIVDAERILFMSEVSNYVCLNRTNGFPIVNTTIIPPNDASTSSYLNPIADGKIFIFNTSSFNNIIAVDIATGGIVWQSPPVAASTAPIYVGGGLLVTTVVSAFTGSSNFTALNTSTGEIVWIRPYFTSRAIIKTDQGLVVVQVSDTAFVRYDPATWTPVWNTTATSDVVVDFKLHGGVVYTTTTNAVHALNATTGTLLWTHYPKDIFPPKTTNVFSRALTVAGGYVVAQGHGGSMLLMSAVNGSFAGRLPWECIPGTPPQRESRCNFPSNNFGALAPGSQHLFYTLERKNAVYGAFGEFLPRLYDLHSGMLIAASDIAFSGNQVFPTPHGALYVGYSGAFLLGAPQ